MNAIEEIANLDRLIHEPARLAILTALSAVENADFLFLQRLTGLTAGNLSTHLAKLAEAGLINIEKQFAGTRPNTILSISHAGFQAVSEHWEKLDTIRKSTLPNSPRVD
jgi:DNA-binding transcriptional ArsR family regulator